MTSPNSFKYQKLSEEHWWIKILCIPFLDQSINTLKEAKSGSLIEGDCIHIRIADCEYALKTMKMQRDQHFYQDFYNDDLNALESDLKNIKMQMEEFLKKEQVNTYDTINNRILKVLDMKKKLNDRKEVKKKQIIKFNYGHDNNKNVIYTCSNNSDFVLSSSKHVLIIKKY